jgi:hypothetical protein
VDDPNPPAVAPPQGNPEPTRFVETIVDNCTIGPRCYRLGSVVSVPESVAKRLIEETGCRPSDGPELDAPAPAGESDDGPAPKGRRAARP